LRWSFSTTAGSRARERGQSARGGCACTLRTKFLQHGRQEESDEVKTNRKKLPQPWLQDTRGHLTQDSKQTIRQRAWMRKTQQSGHHGGLAVLST